MSQVRTLLEEWRALKALKNDLESTLGAASHPAPPNALREKAIEKKGTLSLPGDRALKLEADAAVRIHLFRGDAEEKDADGVLTTHPKKGAEGPQAPPILLLARGGHAWLKYSLEGELSQLTDLPIVGSAALHLACHEIFRLADYRRHGRGESLGAALDADLAHPRSILDWRDVRALGMGDALSFAVNATLSASVDVSWSDILSFSPNLAGTLFKGGRLGIEIDTGLTLSASVHVADDFRVTFAGADESELRVAVTKTKANAKRAGGALGIAIESTVHGVELDRYLCKLAEAVPGRLVDKKRDELLAGLEELAKRKIEAGFTYEYSRIATDTALFQGRVSRRFFDGPLHHEVLTGDFRGLLAHVPEWAEAHHEPIRPPAFTPEHYLRQQELESRRTWGFCLGIGKWKTGGKDEDAFSEVDTLDMAGRRKVAYEGRRSYEDRKRKWATDYRADMAAFHATPDEEPTLSEFRLGIHLAMNLKSTGRGGGHDEWLDWARLWRIVEGGKESAQLLGDLASLDGSKAEASFQLLFGDAAMRGMLSAGGGDFPGALAAAMPWVPNVPERSDETMRRQSYASLWKWHLDGEPAAGISPDLGYRAATMMKKKGISWGCHALEQYSRAGSFADVASSIDGGAGVGASRTIQDRILGFQEGMGLLKSNGSASHLKTIKPGFKRMLGMGSQHFLVRALGVHLLGLAEGAGVLDSVVRTLIVEPEGGDRKGLAYGKGGEASA